MKYTIITALKDILKTSQDSQLLPENLEPCKEALNYLTGKLHISETQAILLSVIINSEEETTPNNITSYLDISLLELLSLDSQVNELVERKYIRRITNTFEIHPSYLVHKAAFEAFMKNEDYHPKTLQCQNYIQFMLLTKEYNIQLSDNDICTDEYKEELLRLTHDNQQFLICQKVKDMAPNDLIVYYTCLNYLISTNKTFFPLKEIFRLFRSDVYASIMESILSHRLPLLTQGIINFYNEEGTAICLSDDLCQHVQQEIHHLRMLQNSIRKKEKAMENNDIHFIDHRNLTKKSLFYNAEEQTAIARLTQALQIDNFRSVQSRLEKNNLRKGLTCLFYGGPGTGKTETVFQIALATGRSLIQIDFSEIRSKWIGQSEKNVRETFNQYRSLCQQNNDIPILLLNEADGLISQRIADISQTCDKEENAVQNILLEELERFEGILIATTNLQDNLDSAFERRFLYKIQFHKPCREVQGKIWQSMMSELSDSDTHTLADHYDFSGAQIENITRKQLIESSLTGQPLQLEKLQKICEQEIMESKRKARRVAGFGK